MMKFLRSQSQTVLVVVLGVIGLGFLFYGNSGNLLTTGAVTSATITAASTARTSRWPS